MLSFLIGYWLCLFGFAIWVYRSSPPFATDLFHGLLPLFALMLVAMPLSALLVSMIAHHSRPRRSFLRGTRRRLAALRSGISAALLSVVFGAAAEIWLYDRASDIVTIPLAAMLATTIVCLTMRRVRAGYCPQCNYDIRGSLGGGRCSECGRSLYAEVVLTGRPTDDVSGTERAERSARMQNGPAPTESGVAPLSAVDGVGR